MPIIIFIWPIWLIPLCFICAAIGASVLTCIILRFLQKSWIQLKNFLDKPN